MGGWVNCWQARGPQDGTNSAPFPASLSPFYNYQGCPLSSPLLSWSGERGWPVIHLTVGSLPLYWDEGLEPLPKARIRLWLIRTTDVEASPSQEALPVRKCAIESFGFCKRKASPQCPHTPYASPVSPTALKTLTRVPVNTLLPQFWSMSN